MRTTFPIALEALARGAHVLVEKPFVIWPQDGEQLMQASSSAGRILAINQTRRTFPIAGELRARIGSGEFGRLRSVVHHEGTKLEWPFESGAGFSPDAQRTGVIMDFGVHAIDFYQYILNPSWSFRSAIHDGFDGPEGLAEIHLLADEAPLSLRLSRYLAQDNAAQLSFDAADVIYGVYDDDAYTVRPRNGRPTVHRVARSASAGDTSAEALILNFLGACEGREVAYCDAPSSLPVVRILDTIYRESTRYPSTTGAV